MDNYTLLSSARTGSSYFSSALAKQIGCIEPNVFYGGEFFRWDEYFQLGPPTSVSTGSLGMLAKDPALLQKYRGVSAFGHCHACLHGRGRTPAADLARDIVGGARPGQFPKGLGGEPAPAHATGIQLFPWVIKVFPEHFECLDLHRFIALLRRENTKAVVLYRSFLWDWFLSWAAVRQTGIFQQHRADGGWEKPNGPA